MTFYCFENARTAGQIAEMRRLEAAGICLFCPDGLARHPPERILLRTRHWTALQNDFPYPGTRMHLLLVPRQHATGLTGLPADAQQDFWQALAAVVRDHQLTYYGLGVRNGDCRYTGASIEHVHAHLLVGEPDPARAGPVRMRFSGQPAGPASPPQPG